MTGLQVAFHAGQLLQPVPGGIGRYERAMLAHLPALGIGPVAFAAGDRPHGVAPRVPWIDLGAPRQILERGQDALELAVKIFVFVFGEIFQRHLKNEPIRPGRDRQFLISV